MKTPFFSIVMPVYNVRAYLKQAIDSVCDQTYGDFELILIDDCSADGSSEICDFYAENDSRIQAVHLKQNGGVSHARNVGMDAATGSYLMFMDSDDYIDKELLQRCYASTQKNAAQIIFFGMTEEHFDKKGKHMESVVYKLPQKYFKDQNELRAYMIEIEKATLYGYACNKFYDLKYLRQLGLRYKEYALNEDILFNVSFCRDIDRLNILDCPAYHYRKVMDDKSRTARYVKEYFKLHVKKMTALYEQYQYWELCDEAVRGELALIYTRYIMSAVQRNCDERAHMNFVLRKEWLKKLYKQKLFLELIPYGRPQNGMVKLLHGCLKHHLTNITLVLGRVIFIVKNKLPGIFNVVQKNR